MRGCLSFQLSQACHVDAICSWRCSSSPMHRRSCFVTVLHACVLIQVTQTTKKAKKYRYTLPKNVAGHPVSFCLAR